MRELIYTLLELERGNRETCDFCSNLYGEDNKSVNQVVTRIKASGKYVADDSVCEECKEKFLNDEIPKCERCGRLQNRHYVDVLSGKYICRCIRRKENLEEKELPTTPYKSQAVYYEEQINALREEKEQITEEANTHLEALEIAEDWHKRQKQELIDEIERLKKEVERLKKLTPEELVAKVVAYEKKIAELEQQNNQQTTQMEVPAKDKGIKGFFKFGSKKFQ